LANPRKDTPPSPCSSSTTSGYSSRSLRVGSLRVIFRLEGDLVLVLAFSIAERGQAYRDL